MWEGGRVIILRQKLGITGTQLRRGCEQEQKKPVALRLTATPGRGLIADAVLGVFAWFEVQVRANGPVWYADWLGLEDTDERNHVIGPAFLLDRDINAVL